jgi:NADPH2:quinone reductase
MRSRAVVMRRTGPPDVLALEEVELAPLAPGEVRLRSLASAVNHSDLEIRAGSWNIRREPKFP